MNFKDVNSVIAIVQNALINYENHLMNKQFIFIYFDDIKRSYEKIEISFTKSHYKHLCGISDNAKDFDAYRSQVRISAKDFYRLCKEKRLGRGHIILKQDGSTFQKLNILNNVYKVIYKPVITCDIEKKQYLLSADKMIGLKDGYVSLALKKLGKYYIPVSTLDYNVKNTGEKCFDVCLVAYKPMYSHEKYQNIVIEKGKDVFDVDQLDEEFRNLFCDIQSLRKEEYI